MTVTPGDVHDSCPYLGQLEDIHKNIAPLQAAAADSAYDFPLAHWVLGELGIDFFVVPQPAYTGGTAAQTAVSKRKRIILGILGRQERLQQMSLASKVFE